MGGCSGCSAILKFDSSMQVAAMKFGRAFRLAWSLALGQEIFHWIAYDTSIAITAFVPTSKDQDISQDQDLRRHLKD